MSRTPRVGAALACVAALCGCGGGDAGSSSRDWIKVETGSATIEREYRDCNDLAETATETDREIDQDIAAARGADLQRSLAVQTRTAQMRDKTRHGAESVIVSCMQQKGFYRRR